MIAGQKQKDEQMKLKAVGIRWDEPSQKWVPEPSVKVVTRGYVSPLWSGYKKGINSKERPG